MPVESTSDPRVVRIAEQVLHCALDEIAAGLVARSGSNRVTAKADGTPVTDVDLEVDRLLRERIVARFPDHGMLTEESTTVTPDTEWTWVIDPIDGTSNYTTDVPYWCVSVALAHRGAPVMGIVDAPVLSRRYAAVRGQGARRNGTPIRVRPGVDWRDPANRHIAVMLTTASARRARAAGVRLNVRVMGSTALDLALVADGGAVGSLALVPHVWDVAAGTLLVEEAGGAVVTLRGEPMLPLVAGVDHRAVSAVTAAAADAKYARELAGALMPTP